MNKVWTTALVSVITMLGLLVACAAPATTPTAAPAPAQPAAPAPAAPPTAPTAAPATPQPAAKPSGQQALLTWATASSGGAGYTYSAAIASIVGKYQPEIKISVLPTAGAVDATKLLREGKAQIALGTGPSDYDALNGSGGFADGKMANLRLLWPGYTGPLHMVTLKTSGIQTLADLKGQRIAVSQLGSTGYIMAENALKSVGLTAKDVTLRPLSAQDMISAIKDGSAAAMLYSIGKNAPTIQDLAVSKEIRFIDLTDEQWNVVKAANPPGLFAPDAIPAGTYPNQDKPAKTFTVLAGWDVLADFDENLAYTITKTFFDHKAEADQIHPIIKETTPQMIGGPQILTYHKGAERYLKETGWLK